MYHVSINEKSLDPSLDFNLFLKDLKGVIQIWGMGWIRGEIERGNHNKDILDEKKVYF